MDAAAFKEKYGLSIKGNFRVPDNVTALPGNLEIGGSLILPKHGMDKLPAHLTVGGNLSLSGTEITAIGSHLSVKGILKLTNSKILELPDHVTVGNLKLSNCALEKLPAYLTVNGYLDLEGTHIKELGEHLTVRGDLNLKGTAIKELADHLWVGDEWWRASSIEMWGGSSLTLDGTDITALPEDCHIEVLGTGRNNLISFGENTYIAQLYIENNRIMDGNPADLKVDNLFVDYGCTDLTFALSLNPKRFIDIRHHDHKLPDNIDLSCALRIRNSRLPQIPHNSRVGSLELIHTSVPVIPRDLQIVKPYGELKLVGREVDCAFEEGSDLPAVEMAATSIKTLPDHFSCSSLAIKNTPMEKLPDKLMLKDSLYVNETRLKRLPLNLEMGGDLCIGSCETIRIFGRILVGGDLHWKNALMDSWPPSCNVFRGVYIAHSRIASLPDDFLVNGNLDISHTNIKALPENLTVVGNLDISHTDIEYLPDSLVVFGKILAQGTSVSKEQCEERENQLRPTGWLPEWEPNYAWFPQYGACEILQDGDNKKFVRLIGSVDKFWIERDAAGKWRSDYTLADAWSRHYGYNEPKSDRDWLIEEY